MDIRRCSAATVLRRVETAADDSVVMVMGLPRSKRTQAAGE